MRCRLRKELLYLFLLFGCTTEQNDWENPEVFAVNKEEPRASFFAFTSEEEALKGNMERSPLFKSLNGTWKFHWVEKPEERPHDPGFWPGKQIYIPFKATEFPIILAFQIATVTKSVYFD